MGFNGILVALVIVAAILGGVYFLFASIWGAASGLSALFILVSVVMMLVILIQKPKGGGLSGAFGGAGGSASDVFGSKTGDVLTWTTVILFVLFLGLGVGLTFATRPIGVAGASPVPAQEAEPETEPVDADAGTDAGAAGSGTVPTRPEVPSALSGEAEDKPDQTPTDTPAGQDPADNE